MTTRYLKIGLVALLSVWNSLTLAATFTLTGNIAFEDAEDSPVPGFDTAVLSLLPNGSSLTYVFDFDLSTPDIKSDPNIGDYQGVLNGTSLTVGGYSFATRSDGCTVNPTLDCRVGISESPGVFSSYLLISDLRDSDALGTDTAEILGLPSPPFGGFRATSSVSLTDSASPPYTTGDDLFAPIDLLGSSSLAGDLSLFFTPGGSFSTESPVPGFVRVNFTLDDINIVEGAVAPVPLPAAAWLFASALGVFGYLAKRKTNA